MVRVRTRLLGAHENESGQLSIMVSLHLIGFFSHPPSLAPMLYLLPLASMIGLLQVHARGCVGVDLGKEWVLGGPGLRLLVQSKGQEANGTHRALGEDVPAVCKLGNG